MRVLLVVYDNGSYVHWFPLGLGYIASVLRECGHEVTIYDKGQKHYPPEHLTAYLDKNKFDVVGLGVIAGYWQYQEMLRISEAINASKDKPLFILGGHGPSPEPKYFLSKTFANIAVMGEGEATIAELLSGKCKETVDGIAYREGKKVTVNKPRELIENIDTIPFPAWDLFSMDYYSLIREPNISNSDRCMPMVTSRGCPFRCNFCYRMDTSVRLRSAGSIVEEINKLKKDYGVSYIAFLDDLFMMSPKRTIELCDALRPLKIKWSCMGRLNYVSPELIKEMKSAGCVFIGYGIECLDDQILKNMNKSLTVDQITRGIETTLAEGVSPGFNIIFGNIGENEETLRKGVDFLLKYDDHSQLRTIRPVTPYPGSDLYYHAIDQGLLEGVADFYENKHKNSDLLSVNFTTISNEKFNECLYDANTKLLKNYYSAKSESQTNEYAKLYFKNDTSFRGLRQT
jgi:anaerobic magnesium-protoporphyrin IX monomethyl ester cyclase